MTYPRGHLPDHPEVAKRRLGMHLHPLFGALMAASSVLPMATTNRAKMSPSLGGPGILDQHDMGSCEGHANGGGGTLNLANEGKSKGLISPTSLYLGALLIDRGLNPDGTLTTVTDTGTMPSSIVTAWQTFGAMLAASDDQYPAQSSTLYVTPSDPNSALILPPPEKLYVDSPYRYNGSYFITAQGTARLLQALAALASGKTISDAIPASQSDFQGYTGGVLGALQGPTDHANYIADYEWLGGAANWALLLTALQQGNTTQAAALAVNLIFHCTNSWSETWGEADPVAQVNGGMYRANTAYFDQAEDLCVLDISSVA